LVFEIRRRKIMSLIQASGLPSILSASSPQSLFAPTLTWPAGLTGTQTQIRARGQVQIPPGFSGFVEEALFGLSGEAYWPIIGGGSAFLVAKNPIALPFVLKASVYAGPFRGSIIDLRAAAAQSKFTTLRWETSAAVVGDQSNDGPVLGFGGGAWNFSNPVSLFVGILGGSAALPLMCQLTQFELEY
jgi:hypothetical protein